MSFLSIAGRGARLAAMTPALWAYGAASAALGAVLLIAGLLAAMARFDAPVGHGAIGWIALGALMAVSLAIEAAASRAAAGRAGLGAATIDAGRLLPQGAMLLPAVIGLAILFCLMIAVPVLAFLRTFLGVLLMYVFPFAIDSTIIIGSAATALALLVPAWMLLPLAVRGIGIHRRSIAESLGDAMTVIGERTGAAVLCGLLCIALDAGLLILATRLHPRDLSLTGRLHLLTAWDGARPAAGMFLLAAIAVIATFKAGLWTALYLDVADEQKWDDSSRPPRTDGNLMRLAALAHGAVHALRRSAVPFTLAAGVVLIGIPMPADLLSMYHLVPPPADDLSLRIMHAVPGGGSTVLLLFVPAMLVSLLFSTALVETSDRLASQQPIALTGALRIGLGKLFTVTWALTLLVGAAVGIGGLVMVGVLFALALVVQWAKGSNQLADQFDNLIGIAIIAVPIVLAPLVVRAVLVEQEKGGAAVGRGFELATSRPRLVLLTFLLTIALEILRGPIAHRAGLLTSGWTELFALTRHVSPPVPRATLTQSAGALMLSAICLAFEAQLWTAVFRQIASQSQPKPEADATAPAEVDSHHGKKHKPTQHLTPHAHEPARGG